MDNRISSWRDALSVTFAGTRHQFLGTQCAPEEFTACLSELLALSTSSGPASDVLRLFVAVSDQRQLDKVNGQFGDRFAALAQRTEVVVQPPLLGQVQINAWRVEQADIATRASESTSSVAAQSLEWHFSAKNFNGVSDAQLFSSFTRQFYDCLVASNEQGHSIEDLLRTWIYIGNITHGHHDETRYQVVNAARRDVFRKLKLNSGEVRSRFPASTGIGTQGTSINLGFLSCRLRAKSDYRVVSLENRRQASAFNYPKEESLVAPLFSRAVAILGTAEAMVFVSGTASIIGAKSVHVADIEQQTIQTLENISILLCERLLSDYDCYPARTGLECVVCYTVYVKRRDDFAVVRAICESLLPDRAVATYVEADVCRNDLLVEIEATAVMAG
jgi:chorismate lyase/3-hydroxybenzoate synthase